MNSKNSSASTESTKVAEALRTMVSYAELQDRTIGSLETKCKWLLRSQIAILLYLILI